MLEPLTTTDVKVDYQVKLLNILNMLEELKLKTHIHTWPLTKPALLINLKLKDSSTEDQGTSPKEMKKN